MRQVSVVQENYQGWYSGCKINKIISANRDKPFIKNNYKTNYPVSLLCADVDLHILFRGKDDSGPFKWASKTLHNLCGCRRVCGECRMLSCQSLGIFMGGSTFALPLLAWRRDVWRRDI
jgi:hypothetical protein